MVKMEKSKKSNKLIKKMMDALNKSAVSSGKMKESEIWPIHPIKIYPYFQPFLKDCKYSINKVKDSFEINDASSKVRPSFLWQWIINFILSSKVLEEDMYEEIIYLLELVKKSMYGDSFCMDSKHIIWNKKELQNNLEKIDFNKVYSNPKKSISELNAYLSNFNQALYWVCNCGFREIHGPYEVKKNGKKFRLLVREYFELNPKKICNSNVDYQKIRTLCFYKPNVKINFVVLNDYYWKGNLNNALYYWKVFGIKNKIERSLNQKEVEQFTKVLINENDLVTSQVNKLTEKEKIISLIQRFYFTLNYFEDAFGLHISKFPKEKIKNLIKNSDSKLYKKLNVNPKNLFDPRIK